MPMKFHENRLFNTENTGEGGGGETDLRIKKSLGLIGLKQTDVT